MKKFFAVLMALVFFTIFPGVIFAAGNPDPVISDFVLEGSTTLPINAKPELKFRFISDQKPEEVLVRFWGDYNGRIIQTVYSSQKGEVKTEVSETDGKYKIIAFRTITTPPGPSSCEITLWIKAGGKKSNEVKQKFETKM